MSGGDPAEPAFVFRFEDADASQPDFFGGRVQAWRE